MNDEFLNQFRKAPRREFADALYQRITNPMPNKSKIPALRYLALSVSIAAVLAAVLFFSPPARAFADGVMRQFGGYIFTQATPQPDMAKQELSRQQAPDTPDQKATLQAEKQMKNQPQVNNNGTASFAPDAAAASQLTGFSVLAPAYIPEGYVLGEIKNVSGGWAVTQENGSSTAMISYLNQADKSFLTIEESKYEQDHPRIVERSQIVEVTVRNQPGVWTPEVDGKNVLVWDENGITYLVVSNTLSLEESQRIAESLGK